jgi:hypothetical protein
VECSTHEEGIYGSNESEELNDPLALHHCEVDVSDKSVLVGEIDDIEGELSKMFANENEETESTSQVANKSTLKKNREISKRENIRELLIRLFGSPLDDVEISPRTSSNSAISKPKKCERNTLPVSIDIPTEEFFQVCRKRKSEGDKSGSSPVKVPKIKFSFAIEQVINVEYFVNSNLVIPPVFSDSALVKQVNELETVKVNDTVEVCRSETVKPVKSLKEEEEIKSTEETAAAAAFIDLTDDVPEPCLPELVEIKCDHLEKESVEPSSIEKDQTAAMPLPQGPAAPQGTAILLVGSVAQNASVSKQTACSQRPPPQQQRTIERPQQQNAAVTNVAVMTRRWLEGRSTTPPPNVTIASPVQPVQSQVTRSCAQRPVTMYNSLQSRTAPFQTSVQQVQQPTQRQVVGGQLPAQVQVVIQAMHQQHGPRAQTQHQQSAQSHTQHQQGAQSHTKHQQSSQYQQAARSQYQLSAQPQYPPQLYRLLRSQPAQEYHLVSYTECGNRIYPHVYKFSNWREYARTFCQQMRNLFTPTDYQQEHARFGIYMNNVTLTFGKNLIRELSTIEVQGVHMNDVLRVVSTKLDNNSPSRMYRTCANIYLMIRSCELLCTTPFTKKFFNAIKMAMERMEARSQEVVLFTTEQFKQLEAQIRQYRLIENWRIAQVARIQQANRPPPHYSSSQRKRTQDQRESYGGNVPEVATQQLPIILQGWPRQDEQSRPDPEPTQPNFRVEVQQSVAPRQAECEISTTQPTTVEERRTTSVIIATPPPASTVKPESNRVTPATSIDGEIIDLTWIDDGDEEAMLEEIIECKQFPLKAEGFDETSPEESPVREVTCAGVVSLFNSSVLGRLACR